MKHQPPIAAKPAQQDGDDGHGNQKAAARNQRRRVQHHLSGHVDIHPPFTIAGHGQGQQRGHERRDDRPAKGKPGIDAAAGDEGIGKQEQLVREQPADRDAQGPDVPAPFRFCIAPEILDR